ncbi:large ribosomal subunit protein mL64 [Anas acuta]|uniref:large ribosomal subunit protein mL64 n=1 Tax=Anas acuta TaxID=28680 RepID=UPI0035C8C8E8
MAAPALRGLALGLARAAVPVRPYRAAPLRPRAVSRPLPGAEERRAEARRFGRLGEAAGVAAERLWPSPEELREREAEEREWEPALRDREAELERREREEAARREERQQLVARSLAAMPAAVAAWRQERAEARERSLREAARRQRLLAEAGARLGGPPRAGDPRAQALLQELERDERRQEKRRRRQEREEAARSALAAAEAAAASQRPPPGGSGVGEAPPESS